MCSMFVFMFALICLFRSVIYDLIFMNKKGSFRRQVVFWVVIIGGRIPIKKMLKIIEIIK